MILQEGFRAAELLPLPQGTANRVDTSGLRCDRVAAADDPALLLEQNLCEQGRNGQEHHQQYHQEQSIDLELAVILHIHHDKAP